MAISQSEVDAAISRVLNKGRKKSVTVDGLTSTSEQLSVDELLKLQTNAAAQDTTKTPYGYKRFKSMSRGG